MDAEREIAELHQRVAGQDERIAELERQMKALRDIARVLGLEIPQVTEGEVHIVSYGGITCYYEGDADPAEVLAAGRRILAEERGELPFGEPPSG